MTAQLTRLVPTLMRHLEAYAEVAGEDARHAASIVGRRLLALLVAAAAAFVSLLMLCAWMLALAWDGPWRSWVAAGLALAFAAVAAALAWPVVRRGFRPDEPFFPRIRSELGRDRELIERAFNGGSRPESAGGDAHARQ
jgi:membrane protein implicated in regulation of membrane protease activity